MVPDSVDPFDEHFASSNLNALISSIKESHVETTSSKHEVLGRLTNVKPYAPQLRKRKYSDYVGDVRQLNLKSRLLNPTLKNLPKLSKLQSALSPPLFNYEDILYGARSPRNATELRDLTALHAVNHVFKTRDCIVKNNARISAHQGEVTSEKELRDQGFTRPKILILLATRHQCQKYVHSITKTSDPDQQENKKRFNEAFSRNEQRFDRNRPEDFRELFEGDNDDDFRLGIKFTRKTMKLHSAFSGSDVILASPLGLRRTINANDPRKTHFDFLSSIEILIIDQADALLMQNWEHVEFAIEHLNKKPENPPGCDFSRVRRWYLDTNAKFLRQTIIFSAYLTPELNALFSQRMCNVAGKSKILPEYRRSMLHMEMPVRQTFVRYNSRDAASDPDDRFQYFTTLIVPSIARTPVSPQGSMGTLIFIPKYYDFVRLRNFFANHEAVQNLSFGAISEYTEVAESQRARAHLLSGKYSLLLYTGRAHHFRRFSIRGVKHVFFYGLPDNPTFYMELVGEFIRSTIDDGALHMSDATAMALFSRWDAMALERIVGTDRAVRMLKHGSGDTFDFR